MPTIKQLADELGVTKQAVRKRVNQLPETYISKGDNNTIVINDDGASIIREKMTDRQPTVTTNETPTVDRLVDMLQAQLETKDRQIEALTAALEHTTASLHAAQALHAATVQQQITDGSGGEQQDADAAPEKPSGLFGRIFGRKKP